ncbi:MAG TPA: recombination protein NinG [Saprospiraceae bacterium]
MKDEKLWKIFSEYIRLRDADDNGFCKCFTCGFTANWKRFDAGHGIPRQHKATKYNERNNHAQCKRCNGFEGGKREVYKEQVNKRYGEGTWEKLEVMSRAVSKAGPYEFKVMEAYYKSEVEKLKKLKGIV